MRIRNLGPKDADLGDLVARACARVGGISPRWTNPSAFRFRLVPSTRDGWRKRRNGRLVPNAVCWHAHGWFLRQLLDLAEYRGNRVSVETVLGKVETREDLLRLLEQGPPEGEACDCPFDEGQTIYDTVKEDIDA